MTRFTNKLFEIEISENINIKIKIEYKCTKSATSDISIKIVT